MILFEFLLLSQSWDRLLNVLLQKSAGLNLKISSRIFVTNRFSKLSLRREHKKGKYQGRGEAITSQQNSCVAACDRALSSCSSI